MYLALWLCVTLWQLILPTKTLTTLSPTTFNISDVERINNVTEPVQGQPSSFEGAIDHGLKFLAYYTDGPLWIWRITLKADGRRSARASDFRKIRLVAQIRDTNRLVRTDAEYLYDWEAPAFFDKPEPPASDAYFRAWDWQEKKVSLEKAMTLSQTGKTPVKWRGIGLLWRTREPSIAFEFHTSDVAEEVDISAVNGARILSLPPEDAPIRNSTFQNSTSQVAYADDMESR